MASEQLAARRLAFTEGNYEAWLAGRKSMTRRVIVPQPQGVPSDAEFREEGPGLWSIISWGIGPDDLYRKHRAMGMPADVAVRSDGIEYLREFCPYGPVGTPLGVQEPFRVTTTACYSVAGVEYKWGGGGWVDGIDVPRSHWHKATSQPSKRWHSPRFMPLWACRRWSRNEGVRVERVQDISEADALAEGCNGGALIYAHHRVTYHRDAFKRLWDSINGGRTILHKWEDDDGVVHRERVPSNYVWAANPLVWVLSLAPPQDKEDDS